MNCTIHIEADAASIAANAIKMLVESHLDSVAVCGIAAIVAFVIFGGGRLKGDINQQITLLRQSLSKGLRSLRVKAR